MSVTSRVSSIVVSLALLACQGDPEPPAQPDGGGVPEDGATPVDGGVPVDGDPDGDGGTPGDGGPPPLPPGSWAEAGLDPAAGALDVHACATAGIAGRRYLYVDGSAAGDGDGQRTSPLRSVAAAVARVGAGERAILCIAAETYDNTINSGADVFGDGREYVLVGGYLPGTGFATRDAVGHRTHLRGPGTGAATLTFGNVRALTLDGLELSGGRHGLLIQSGYSTGRSLTIRNCHVHDNGIDGGPEVNGGGLRVSGSSILIEHSVIERNRAGRLGGGVFIGSPASAEQNRLDASGALVLGTALARIEHTIVRGNTLRFDTPHGVGLALGINSEVVGNVIADNRGFGVPGGGAAVGGGLILQTPLATALIAENWIEGNVAEKYGAGVFIDEASIGTLVNNVLIDNLGDGQVAVDGRAGGNAAGDRGYATVVHATIIGGDGPALAAQDATLRVYNTLCHRIAGGAAVGAYTGGAVGEDVLIDGTTCAGATGVTGAVVFGAAQLTCDPAFVDPLAGDLRPAASSTCAGRGLTSFAPARVHAGAWSAPPATDALGGARPSPPTPGALEPAP